MMANVNKMTFDPDEVQINQSYTMVNSRIEYFLKRKREEINERNTKMYCSPVIQNNNSCASRTCNTVESKRQKTSECFVKKTKVHNPTGPLCNGGFDPVSESSCKLSNDPQCVGSKPDVYERITNLEKCLKIKSDDPKSFNIYEKLKSIEDHVLKLENMLLNSNGNFSLSNIISYDEHYEIINKLKSSYSAQNNCQCADKNNFKNEDSKRATKHKNSKYTADEIQKLIDNIKRTGRKPLAN